MAKKEVTKRLIQKGFQDYLLDEGKEPETVRIFTKYLKISEVDFYEKFGSLRNIECSIWEDYFRKALDVVKKDPEFSEMDSREKHLSFLFTLIEAVKGDRSYIQYRLLRSNDLPLPRYLTNTRHIIIDEEIDWVTPPNFIPEKRHDMAISAYKNILWKHAMALIFFWVKDDTGGATDTDAFIEKSTRTLFDVGELPALNSLLDLGKFFLQKIGFTKVPN